METKTEEGEKERDGEKGRKNKSEVGIQTDRKGGRWEERERDRILSK